MTCGAKVPLSELITQFKLETLYAPDNLDEIALSIADVNRPGLQLTGFYDYFVADRLQMLGLAELNYLEKLAPPVRQTMFANLLASDIPALVICHGGDIGADCLEVASKHQTAILRTNRDTSDFIAACIAWLKLKLAPCITRHGVLVEVYGEGLLLLGESGVGKSETAIELVKRGHRLIADDAVEIRRTSDITLVGTSPECIRHYIELRGIGIIDVRRLFGVSAVKPSERVDLIIHLEDWNENTQYDRLGTDNHYTEMLGIDVPSITVPVKPGRNLAIIIEVAAMNSRQKKMGYNDALEFTKKINKHFESQWGMKEQ